MSVLPNRQYRWWDIVDFTQLTSMRPNIEQVATFSFLSRALNHGQCVFEYSKSGVLSISYENLTKQIDQLSGRIINSASSTGEKTCTYSWSDTIVAFSFETSNDDSIYVRVLSTNKTLYDAIINMLESSIKHTKQGRAYVFAAGEGGPELRQLPGQAGIELERRNYAPNILRDYDHVVKDLNSSDPCAKLVIIDGEPGTGKTYLVRGIANAVPDAMFVLVPPSMIPDMMSPQFIPVLMDHHKNKQPIIFIVEDADTCLVKREGDNMNSISSLLNLGAGMFGDSFDIRVIATTNARKLDMDKAITRNGRCCRYIETDVLPREQAEEIFQRLSKDSKKFLPTTQKMYMLADIYHTARNDRDNVDAKPEPKLGFCSV